MSAPGSIKPKHKNSSPLPPILSQNGKGIGAFCNRKVLQQPARNFYPYGALDQKLQMTSCSMPQSFRVLSSMPIRSAFACPKNRNAPRVPYYFTVGMDKTALFIKLDRFICRQRFHRSQPLVDDAGSCFNLLKILSCLFDALSYPFQCVAKLRKLLFDAPQKLPHL